MDLLIDCDDESLLTVSLNAREFVIQWHSLPDGGLRAMQGVLEAGPGEWRELYVGEIFGVPLRLVQREGVFSFKSVSADSSTDLFRFDIPPDLIEQIIEALDEAIGDWERRCEGSIGQAVSEVIFGKKELFGIEVTDPEHGFVTIMVWVDGMPLGDSGQVSMLRSLQLDVDRFCSRYRGRQLPTLAQCHAGQVRNWHNALLQKEPETLSEAREIDSLIYSVQLFAFAPEGLSTVNVVVFCSQTLCTITGWDTMHPEIGQVSVFISEMNGVLADFSEWKVTP